MNRRVLGAAVAFAAASLVASNAFAGDKPADKPKTEKKQVKCAGMNECKGKGACGSADGKHGCAGSNECKGKGWILVADEATCTKAKGTVVKEEKKDDKKGAEKPAEKKS